MILVLLDWQAIYGNLERKSSNVSRLDKGGWITICSYPYSVISYILKAKKPKKTGFHPFLLANLIKDLK